MQSALRPRAPRAAHSVHRVARGRISGQGVGPAVETSQQGSAAATFSPRAARPPGSPNFRPSLPSVHCMLWTRVAFSAGFSRTPALGAVSAGFLEPPPSPSCPLPSAPVLVVHAHYLDRAHSLGHARQHLNLLGFALMVNFVSLRDQALRRDGPLPNEA